MKKIEENYGDVLENWDGEMKAFKGIDRIIKSLLSKEKLLEKEIEEIRLARERIEFEDGK